MDPANTEWIRIGRARGKCITANSQSLDDVRNHAPPFRLLLLLCCAAAAAMRFSESENLLPRADMAAGGGLRKAEADDEADPPPPAARASTADFLLLVAAAATEAACWPYPEEPVPPSRMMRISQQLMFCGWAGTEGSMQCCF